MKTRIIFALAATATATLGCSGQPDSDVVGDAPSFALGGKYDGVTDDVRFTEDLGKFAEVRGQFVDGVRYRAFTLEAEDGDVLSATLAARDDADTDVAAQLLVYGPAQTPNSLFDEVAHASAQEVDAGVEFEADAGYYLVVAARDDATALAKFDFGLECINCQVPVNPQRECRPGRLFVEGSFLDSQEWDRCDVILLEETTLPEGETLTIGPDVRVLANFFQDGADADPQTHDNRLTIDGTLAMETREGHPVRFENLQPGLQWQGVVVNSTAEMHDIQVRDALTGITLNGHGSSLVRATVSNSRHGIQLAANESSLRDIELFDLEGHGIRLAAEYDVGIERASIHDTAVALERRSSSIRDLEGLQVLDSEFHNNALVFDSECRRTNNWTTDCDSLSASFIASNHFTQNAEIGSFYTGNVASPSYNSAAFDPESAALFADNVFSANTRGLRVFGAVAFDGNRFEHNEDNPLLIAGSHVRIRNNIFKKNTPHCEDVDWGVFRPAATSSGGPTSTFRQITNNEMLAAIRGCSALRLERVTGSVRNNMLSHNYGHGLVSNGFGDWTLQQNLIESNGAAGLLFTDNVTSRVDIYLNEFVDNEKHFAFLPRCSERFVDGEFQESTCGIRTNVLIQDNNVLGGHDLFRIELLSDRAMDVLNTAALTAIGNFLEGHDDTSATASLMEAHPALETPPVTVSATVDERLPFAGLLVPLE